MTKAKQISTPLDYLIRLKNGTSTFAIKATTHTIDSESGFAYFHGIDNELLIVAISEIASISRKYPPSAIPETT
jgi:hypothetical protein